MFSIKFTWYIAKQLCKEVGKVEIESFKHIYGNICTPELHTGFKNLYIIMQI